MRYLLDTCVLLWALADERAKMKGFTHILEDSSHEVVVSVVSYWEIAIKKSLGKLECPDDLVDVVQASGFRWLSLTCPHIETLEKLPLLHTDPFDRLLIAQAQNEGFKLLTTDEKVLMYF